MHNQLLDQPTYRASQVATSAATADLDNNQTDDKINESTEARTKQNPAQKPQHADQILIHYNHEKRLDSIKRDMHKAYDKVFKNTPVGDIKMIVGNRNRRDAKHQLIRKRPNKHLLQNKPVQKGRNRKQHQQKQNETMSTEYNNPNTITEHNQIQ
ncbi:unnamed protein product [Rotaria sp. Silwood1]|nr:unnamed protein product [Rotaria sp. Silwood1]CAF3954515.1 unnamed protein product [Rotaria sp. Silwood1]